MPESEEKTNWFIRPGLDQALKSQPEQNLYVFIRKAQKLHGKSAIVTAVDETINSLPGLLLKFEPWGDDPAKIEEIHREASKITVPHEDVTAPGRVRDVMANSGPNQDYVLVWIPGKSVADVENA